MNNVHFNASSLTPEEIKGLQNAMMNASPATQTAIWNGVSPLRISGYANKKLIPDGQLVRLNPLILK